MKHIYHIAQKSDWLRAQQAGVYAVSTRGKSLSEAGFIHCSFRDQVQHVAGYIYKSMDNLVLLEVDPAKLISPLQVEDSGGEKFPHIYGPLNLDAVINVVDFVPQLPNGL